MFKFLVSSVRNLVYVFNLVQGLSSYFLPCVFEPLCCLQCVYDDLHIHMYGKPPTFSVHKNASFFWRRKHCFSWVGLGFL